jgi:PAS domain S-box-containing protein
VQTHLDPSYQVGGFQLFTPSLRQVEVIGRASVVARQVIPVSSLAGIRRGMIPDTPLRLQGNITYRRPDGIFHLYDGSAAIRLRCKGERQPRVGQGLRVDGFLNADHEGVLLQAWSWSGTGPMPNLRVWRTTLPQLQSPNARLHEGMLAQMEGVLEGDSPGASGRTLTLRNGRQLFEVRSVPLSTPSEVPAIGSVLRVTGVLVRVREEMGSVRSYHLVPRSAQDVLVIRHPQWWTLRHTLMTLASALVTLVACGGWALLLRRRVQWLESHSELREQYHRAIHETEERFRVMADAAPVLLSMTDETGACTFVNRPWMEFTGQPMSEHLGTGWMRGVHPEDLPRVEEMLQQRKRVTAEFRLRDGGGCYRWQFYAAAPREAPDGRFTGLIGSCVDITDRRDLEEQLRQSQKMEAIGQLAGGVAHDFNNLLTAIIGYSDLMAPQVMTTPALRRGVTEIRKAADRAADLTRQLLAFGRRQVLQPKLLDMGEVVAGMERMLCRLIGENIELISRREAGLSLVQADQGQIEQVILNLAVNARDAMPGGGTLTITVRNQTREGPGGPLREVLMEVRDTGTGIDPTVVDRIFEPFFTTKEMGKGTGLGLSTVHGIVHQSGGRIAVESEPGQGTLFRVTLPRAEDTETLEAGDPERGAVARGSETLLLVEDEEFVLSLVAESLGNLGYGVLQAPGPEAALELCREHGARIGLLISDVIMPGMDGVELTLRIREMVPQIPVLLMSGYTADVLPGRLGLADTGFLQKPFSSEDLALKVREVLDQSRAQRLSRSR